MTLRLLAVAAQLILTIHLCSHSACAETHYLGNRIAVTRYVKLDQFDHSQWDVTLRKYVDSNGMVNYRRLKASAEDQAALDGYLLQLSAGHISGDASNQARLAFWINAYNAVTLRGIIDVYPTSSIRNHTAKVFGYNIWTDLQLYVENHPHSLDHMEHKILRKMQEPRIHFAIVCASIGCPRLLNKAYTPSELEAQLDSNARDFFTRAQNYRFEPEAKKFYLSSILKWFAEDFGADQAARLRRIAPWLPGEPDRQAALHSSAEVFYLDYNWDLNEQR